MTTNVSYEQCNDAHTRSVQKVSLIFNFNGLRTFDFQFFFFCGVMLVLVFSLMPTSSAILNVPFTFRQMLDVFDFRPFQEMNQSVSVSNFA